MSSVSFQPKKLELVFWPSLFGFTSPSPPNMILTILNLLYHQLSINVAISFSSPQSQHANQKGNNILTYALTHTEMHTKQISVHGIVVIDHQLLDKFQVPCWKDKPVFVSVYVERPKRRLASTTRHHHYHHHHHVHHTIKQEVIHHGDGAGGKGYTTSRRAELLQCSQRLRQSARTTPPSIPSVPNPNHTSNPQPQAEVPSLLVFCFGVTRSMKF